MLLNLKSIFKVIKYCQSLGLLRVHLRGSQRCGKLTFFYYNIRWFLAFSPIFLLFFPFSFFPYFTLFLRDHWHFLPLSFFVPTHLSVFVLLCFCLLSSGNFMFLRLVALTLWDCYLSWQTVFPCTCGLSFVCSEFPLPVNTVANITTITPL